MVTVSGKTHVLHELKRNFRTMGFVNITGLEWVATMHDEEGTVQSNKKTLCRWDHKDDTTIAILENGEVWMRYETTAEVPKDLRNFLRRICPRGLGAETNLPENYIIDFRHILDRIRNAYSDAFGSAVPRPF